MTTYLSKNRYLAALQIGLRNLFSAVRYQIHEAIGSTSHHFFRIGDIGIWIRSRSPDLKVLRSCLLGEFDEALDLAGPDARFIVDAGGYIGLTSILFAKRFPQAQVVCLEPSKENFLLARRNCAPFPNITVLNCALGAETGRESLWNRGTGQWGFTTSPGGGIDEAVQMEQVEVVSLPDLLAEHGAQRIDLFKLDVEGAEYELFQTSSEWIDACKVLVVELHERIRPGVTALYAEAIRNRWESARSAEKRLSVKKDA